MGKQKKSLANLVKELIKREEHRVGFMGFDIGLDKNYLGKGKDRLTAQFSYQAYNGEVRHQLYEYYDGERIK